MLPRTAIRKHARGQDDHVDAWLISYADLITMLFMLFVIAVSVSVSKHNPPVPERFSTLALGAPHDEIFRALSGIVQSVGAERSVAVEKNSGGVWIDMSALQFFSPGSADIPESQLPLLKSMLKTISAHLNEGLLSHDTIEVEGYTDDQPLKNGRFANNWELASMRAARIVSLLAEEGVDPARLRATSHAGNHPLVPNADAAGNPIPENRNRNQRIVIKILAKVSDEE